MANIKYNTDVLRRDLALYEYDSQLSTRDIAYYSGHRVVDDDSDYGFVDWAKDSRADFYRNVQKGEMQEAQDVMASSKINQSDADYLLKYYYGGQQDELDDETAENAVKNLIHNGVIQDENEISEQRLKEIIQKSQQDYDQYSQVYEHNLKQYQNDLNRHDISQYYTRRSNESTFGWGNFYFKLPATMGTSMTSPLSQLGSLAAGLAAAAVGQQIFAGLFGVAGATAGSTVAPGAGTVGGGITGASIGASIGTAAMGLAGSQLGGGMQAREYESHMEAFNFYYDNAMKLANEEGVDVSKVASNVKQQLEQRGENTEGLTEDLLIQRLLTSNDLKSGSATFDRIAQDAFKGSRRVYEKNNALGVGEAVVDMLSFLPFFKMGRPVVKAVKRAVSKSLKPLGKIVGGLSKRFDTGVDIARAAAVARNKKKLADVTSYLKYGAMNMFSEGTEEGRQYMIADEAKKGKYNDENANDSFFDAVADGQIFEDVIDNMFGRVRAAGAFFNLDPEYKDDDELYENMLVGAIMPFTSPQGMVQTTMHTTRLYKNLKDSNKAHEYMSAALAQQDYINRIKESYDIIRGRQVSDENMSDYLDRMNVELKKKDKDGKIRKYNLDSMAITEDGSVPTDADIDEFFRLQKQEYAKLVANKKSAKDQLKAMDLDQDEESTFLALRMNAVDEYDESSKELQDIELNTNEISDKVMRSPSYIEKLSRLGIDYDNLTDDQKKVLFESQKVNSALKSISQRIDKILNQINVYEELAANKNVKAKGLIDGAITLESFQNLQSILEDQKKILLDTLKESSVDESVLSAANHLALETIDQMDQEKVNKAYDNLTDIMALNGILGFNANTLTTTKDSEKVRQLIDKYKSARRRQEKLADIDNESARTGVQVQTGNGQKVGKDQRTADDVLDLTSEQIEQRRQENEQSLNKGISDIKSLIDQIPDDSYLSDIKNKINGIVGDVSDPIDYARFVSRALMNLKRQYDEDSKNGNISEEDKQRYANLYEAANHLQSQLDRALALDAEHKARAERKPIKLPSNSQVWQDEQGNRYQIRMGKSEYSEDDGLMLHLRPLLNKGGQQEMDAFISRMQKLKDKIEHSIDNETEENKESNDRKRKMVKALDDIIASVKENQDSKEIVIKADDPYLAGLFSIDNEGKVSSLGFRLSQWRALADIRIEADKNHRRATNLTQEVTGDVRQLSDNTETDKDTSLVPQEDLAKVNSKGKSRVKAYPLRTTDGSKAAARLTNAYYRQQYWYGKILMPYLDAKDAEDVLKERSKVVINGKEHSRLNAVKLFHKLGGQIVYMKDHKKMTNDFYKQLQDFIDGKVDSVKIGGATFTAKQLDYLVYVLPLRGELRNGRTGKQVSRVYLPDLGSDNRQTQLKRGDAEYNSRADIILNLLLSYKKPKNNVRSDQLEGLTEEQFEQSTSNGVTVKQGMVNITYRGFDHATRLVFDDDSFIFRTADGRVMTNQEREEHYQKKIADSISSIQQKTDQILDLAHQLGYESATKELLEQTDENGVSNLFELLTATAKYGDGVIARDTYANVLRQVFGLSADTESVKDATNARARVFLRYFQNNAPELFVSYKNYQDDNNLTPSVDIAVEDALSGKFFQRIGAVKIFKDGEEVNTTDSEENRQNLTEMMKLFEKMIRNSHDSEEFMQALKDLGYSFRINDANLNKSKQIENAENLLKDYFVNRRFSRLSTSSNIVNAMTLGTSTPLNRNVNEDNFNRKVIHNHNKISSVKSLHLKKDEKTGIYYFSLTDYASLAAKKEIQDTIENANTELSQRIEQSRQEYSNLAEEVSKIRTITDLVKWLQGHKKAFEDQDYESLTKTNKKGETVLRSSLKDTKHTISDLLQLYADNDDQQIAQQYSEFIEEQLQKDADMEMRSTPVQFAYGSYERTDAGAPIIYYDEQGNKHEAQATGTPGAIYLDMPAFLFSDGKRKFYHLNPKRFDRKMATFIAELFEVVAKGKSLEDFSNEITTRSGYKIKSPALIGRLLSELIYFGREAIITNPSAENYKRLLFVDNQGQVHFGSNSEVLTDGNFDKFVNFILENKTYRIDRNRIVDHAALFGTDIEITDPEGNVIFSRNSLDNYIASVIDDGILTCDLSTRSSSNIVTGPDVYMDFVPVHSFVYAPNSTEVEGTAASNKQKLKDELEESSKDEIGEELDKEDSASQRNVKGKIDKKQAVQKAKQYMARLEKQLVKWFESGDITSAKVVLKNATKYKKEKQADSVILEVEIQPVGDADGATLVVIPGKNRDQFIAQLALDIKNGKNPNVLIIDKDDNRKAYKWDLSSWFDKFSEEGESAVNQSNKAAPTKVINIFVTSKEEAEEMAKRYTDDDDSSENEPIVPTEKKQTPRVKEEDPEAKKPILGDGKKPSANAPSFVGSEEATDMMTPKLSVEGNRYTITYQGETITGTLDESDKAIMDKLYDEFEDAFGESQENEVKRLLEQARKQPPTNSNPPTNNNRPTPGSRFEAAITPEEPATPQFATDKQLNDFVAGRQPADDAESALFAKFRTGVLSQNEYLALHSKYMQSVHGISRKDALPLIAMNQELRSRYNLYLQGKGPFTGKIIDFLEGSVQKEDFEQALARAEQILGNGFDLSFLHDTPKVYDKVRGAMIYVFGQCASSGIRLFRDADGRIAKGSLYHEAFHKISLFILSKEEREQMYMDAVEQYDELANATEQQIEEFLADRFADFVLDNTQRKGGKYYSSNPVFRFFQKIFDKIRQILNKMFDANITPRYTNLDKLFKDMYSGRYAYAKATSENIEEFSKVYSGYTPYKGYRVGNVILADDSIQYSKIYRDLLGKLVRIAGIQNSVDGRVEFNPEQLRQELLSDIRAYKQSLDTLLNNKDRILESNKTRGTNYTMDDIDTACLQMFRFVEVISNVLKDENWKVWKNILENDLNRKFNLKRDVNNSPNTQANNNTTIDVDGGEVPEGVRADNDFKTYTIAAYEENLFDASHVSMKLLLWGITQFDESNPESAKFTPDGILEYANVQDLFRKVCDVITNSRDVNDMLERLRVAGQKEAANTGDYSITQLYNILSNENTNPNIVRTFFSDFVRHIHSFINYSWQSTQTDKGIEYTAQVRNNNLDTINDKLSYQWMQQLRTKIVQLGDLIKSVPNKFKALKTELQAAMRKYSSSNSTDNLKTVITKLQQTYGIGSITGDLNKDAYIYEQMIRNTGRGSGSSNLLFSVINDLLRLNNSDYMLVDRNIKNHSKLKDFFGEKGSFTALTQKLSDFVPNTSKNTSQRGAKGVKIYPIGAYNFITNTIERAMKTDAWKTMMANNPYNFHSRWLKEILRGADNKIKFHTALATVLNDEYNDSVEDIKTTPVEDLLNKFTAILSGYHTIPSLANKKFSGLIEGISQLQDVFDRFGNISDAVIDQFRMYLADEILAISDAMYLRKEFLRRLNEATGGNYTAESLAKMPSLEQEKLFKNRRTSKLLKMLKKTYHYSDIDPQIINIEGKRTMIRVFGLDLRKGKGYQFRHFKNIMKDFEFTDDLVESMSGNSLVSKDRAASIAIAEEIASRYTEQIRTVLERNIASVLIDFQNRGLITQVDANVETGQVDINRITNKCLPSDVILKYIQRSDKNAKSVKFTGQQLYNAIGYYVIQSMSDNLEFEKLISGDIGYHKNIISVNKRYSGLTSTFQLNDSQGSLRNALGNDRLFDSPTYNTVEVNTTKVVNKVKFESDLFNSLLSNIEVQYKVEITDDGPVIAPIIDYRQLLDDNNELLPNVKRSPLGKRYVEARNTGRIYGINEDGSPKTDEQLAKDIIEKAITDFSGYLNNDPTDAAVFITFDMFRHLKQISGEWNSTNEACYNLMRYYRNLDQFVNDPVKNQALRDTCSVLNVDYDTLMNLFRNYKREANKKQGNKKVMQEYRDFIIDATKSLDLTSLKYIYYGNSNGREDGLVDFVYDKMSLITLCDLLTEGHEADMIYQTLKENQVDCLKFESATKSGGVPSFELFDQNGAFDPTSILYSVIQPQNFSQLNKQLNTDPHHSTSNDLLTQFMKIAMMNIQDNEQYIINGEILDGKWVKDAYKTLLDELTQRGYEEFKEEFGISDSELNKDKFMAKLRQIVSSQDLPQSTLSSLEVVDGEYIVHPSVFPNIRFIQSRLISEMNNSVIKTQTPGQPLYQQPSLGYDDIFDVKATPDSHLLMPGEMDSTGKVNRRMQVKLSITFFSDIISQAQKLAKEGKLTGYGDMTKFSDQRRFIMDNQELFTLSYRVPTQGQNSTIPVQIVDIYPPQKGGVIQFPAGITALTGSDFDIDKMFLARYNYIISGNKLQKLQYELSDIENVENVSTKKLQNMLLDLFQSVLTSNHHYLEANVPLDVCTGPLKDMAQKEISNEDKANGNLAQTVDGYYLNPVFQTSQKEKNAGSDAGIGPMALNSVFRYFIQVSGLRFLPNAILQMYGLQDINKMYDRYGDDILDITSALINAHVDAVKDNYIGKVNVNGYTFNITSLLITTGFGNDTFAFLSQPILKEIARNWMEYKQGHISTNPDLAVGNAYLNVVRDRYIEIVRDGLKSADVDALASQEEMSRDFLLRSVNNPSDSAEYAYLQLRYLNTFLKFRELANQYNEAIRCAQIDTEKFGISADEMIAFDQKVDKFISPYNIAFENPTVLFDNTFLGLKYEYAVREMFETFQSTIFEFSEAYKNIADQLSKLYGVYGRSKDFLKRVGPRIKAVVMMPFFRHYLQDRYPQSNYPLWKLVTGPDSLFSKYTDIKNKCLLSGEGVEFFNNVKYNSVFDGNSPQFFIIDPKLKDDVYLKSNFQASIEEMFDSNDPEIRQWIKDFMVYMFFVTAGSDSNAGGIIKTSVYDIVPPQCLASLSIAGEGSMTFNEYMSNIMSSGSTYFGESELDQIMLLTGLSDDTIVKTVRPGKNTVIRELLKDKVISIQFGSRELMNSNGEFDKIIKVVKDGKTSFYRLGNATYSYSKKQGKYYLNPIYYKVNKLGYRMNSQASFSIRADGYVDGNGRIKSLLNNNLDADIYSYNDLTEKQQQAVMKALGVTQDSLIMLDVFNGEIDYSKALRKELSDTASVQDRIPYLLIKQADAVYYINTGTKSHPMNLLNYAENHYKEFHQITSVDQDIPTAYGGKIVIIGRDYNSDIIDKIVQANSNKQILTNDTSDLGLSVYQDPITNIQTYLGMLDINNKIIINEGRQRREPISTRPIKQGSKVHRSTENYTRTRVSQDSNSLYLFTDNLDRTSMGSPYGDSWYREKYGEGGYGSMSNHTTAVVRGLPNAAPLTTMKAFYKLHSDMPSYADARLTDNDYDTWVQAFDDEIETIKRMWDSGNYDKVVVPNSDFLFNSTISNISKTRTPKIYEHMEAKLKELYDYIDSNPSGGNSTLIQSSTESVGDINMISSKTAAYGVEIARGGSKGFWKIVDSWQSVNPNGIVAYRKHGDSSGSFSVETVNQGWIGNPFSTKTRGADTVQQFYEWLVTGNNFGNPNATEEFRQAILNKIENTPEGSPTLYYTELNRPSHATVIGYLIQHKPSKSSERMQGIHNYLGASLKIEESLRSLNEMVDEGTITRDDVTRFREMLNEEKPSTAEEVEGLLNKFICNL